MTLMKARNDERNVLKRDLTTLVEGVLWAWLPDIDKATRGQFTHLDFANYIEARDARDAH